MSRGGALSLSILLVGGAALSSPMGADELANAWAHWSQYRDIEMGTAGSDPTTLVRVPVPQDVFAAARTDLADVRVIDAEGTEIGFVVFAPGEARRVEWRDAPGSEQGFVPGEYSQAVLDTQADLDPGDRRALHDAVRLELPASTEDLFVWVEIAASDDAPTGHDATWRIVRRRAPLYRFTGRPFERGLTLRYSGTRDRWLRLRFLDPDRELRIDAAKVAELSEEPARLEPFPGRLVADPAAPTGETWFRPPEEMTSLPVTGLRARTERDAFHRRVDVWVSDDGESWRHAGAGLIFRYGPFAGEPADLDDLSDLEFTFREAAAPWWRVVVSDRDDPPIDDLEIELLVRTRQIVFRPSGTAPYRLVYGNPRAEAPEYELSRLARREALAGARPARLGPEERNETWRSGEPFTERHPILLWLALGLVVLVLAVLALRTLRS